MADNYKIGIDVVATDSATTPLTNVNSSLLDLERAQDGATDSMNRAKTAATDTNTAMSNFTNEIKNAVAAWGLFEVAGKVVEFVNLGQEVRVAEATFNELTAGIGGAEDALNLMRQATGGVVDDMTLMQGANRLLLMGLAENATEAAELTEIATTLGRAMGKDAGQAIEDFSLLLSNNSVLRLDNFGLGASRVKARMEELEAQGYDTNRAFVMATLEQGRLAIERIGVAAEVARSPLDRLGTGLTNALQGVAASAREGIEGLAGIGEMLLGLSPVQQQVQSQFADLIMQFPELGEALGNQMWSEFRPGDAIEQTQFMDAVNQVFAMSPELVGNIEVFKEAVRQQMAGTFTGDMDMGLLEAFQVTGTAMQQNPEAFEQAGEVAANSFAQGFEAAPPPTLDGLTTGLGEEMYNAVSDANAAVEDFFAMFEEVPEVPEFLSADGAQSYADSYEMAKSQLEEIKAMAEEGLVGDDEVTRAEALVDQWGDAADQAERAQQAFENIKLSEVFGEGSGGLAGQMTDDLLKALEASGAMGEGELAALQQTLDLSSGRATEASVSYEEQLLPLMQQIASQLGPEAVALAMENVSTFLETAALEGLSPDQIAGGLTMATGFNPETGQIQEIGGADPGDLLYQAMGEDKPDMGEIADQAAIVQQTLLDTEKPAVDVSESMSAAADAMFVTSSATADLAASTAEANINITAINEGFTQAGTKATELSGAVSGVTEEAAQVRNQVRGVTSDINALVSGVKTVRIKLDVLDPQGVLSLIAGGGSSAQDTRDRGGTVAGQDDRAR